MPEREHDLVIFGATGFTGGLTAEYVAAHAPPGTRWALAGRTPAKLEALRERLVKINPACADLPLLGADVNHRSSLDAVAQSAKVVITTVGPYVKYGEPLVAACARAGTAYLDLTGEPEFVDRMYVEHHKTAVESGARLIHACGFDSIPHDMGAWFNVQQLPEGVPLTVNGYVRAGGRPSGGTLESALLAMSRLRQSAKIARERKQLEQRPAGRSVHGSGKPHRALGAFALPAPTIDPQVVLRSASALDRYGPDFTYGHYMSVRSPFVVAGAAAGIGSLVALAQIPPARRFIGARLAPGQGPSPEQRAKSWFKVTHVGEGGGKTVTTRVSGGDPGYDETAKMLAEAALTLIHEDVPDVSGQVTTAVAMGAPLVDRLQKAGIRFEVI